MAAASSSRTLTVSLSESTEDECYVLRGLQEEEIPQWSAFCASIFAYKDSPPPPEYFERHYNNDPDRRAAFIRVACHQDSNEIVASCRIFDRTISTTQGSVLKAGGIGEACTSPNHRKRGLSKELLMDCIRIMKAEGFQVSFLHSAPAFFPVYQSAGYQCVATKWTLLPMDAHINTDSRTDAFAVRLAQFPNDTTQLMTLHQSFSEQRFHGCIVRSKEYWEQYLAKELGGSLFVVEQENAIIGWMSLRGRGTVIQLREFGWADKTATDSSSTTHQFSMLLEQAIKAIEANTRLLAMPSLVYDYILNMWGPNMLRGVKLEEAASDDDLGWMYMPLNGLRLPDFDAYLMWPSDSF